MVGRFRIRKGWGWLAAFELVRAGWLSGFEFVREGGVLAGFEFVGGGGGWLAGLEFVRARGGWLLSNS